MAGSGFCTRIGAKWRQFWCDANQQRSSDEDDGYRNRCLLGGQSLGNIFGVGMGLQQMLGNARALLG